MFLCNHRHLISVLFNTWYGCWILCDFRLNLGLEDQPWPEWNFHTGNLTVLFYQYWLIIVVRYFAGYFFQSSNNWIVSNVYPEKSNYWFCWVLECQCSASYSKTGTINKSFHVDNRSDHVAAKFFKWL